MGKKIREVAEVHTFELIVALHLSMVKKFYTDSEYRNNVLDRLCGYPETKYPLVKTDTIASFDF